MIENIYKHYKNNKKYKVVNYCRIQENDIWVTGILYKQVDGNVLFVRSEEDFERSFKLKTAVKENKNRNKK